MSKGTKLIVALVLAVAAGALPANALVGISCGNRYANCTNACHTHDFMNCAAQHGYCGDPGSCDTCNIVEEICQDACDIKMDLCLQGFPQE